MATSPTARRDELYAAMVSFNPETTSLLSPAEITQLKAGLLAIWGTGDLNYLVNNVDVLPSAHSGEDLNASTAIPGVVTSGAGSGGATVTNALGPIEGKGSIA